MSQLVECSDTAVAAGLMAAEAVADISVKLRAQAVTKLTSKQCSSGQRSKVSAMESYK